MFQLLTQSQYEIDTEIQAQQLLALMRVTDNSRKKLSEFEESRGLCGHSHGDVQEDQHEYPLISFEPFDMTFEKQQLVVRPVSCSSESSIGTGMSLEPKLDRHEEHSPITAPNNSCHLRCDQHPNDSLKDHDDSTLYSCSFAQDQSRVLSDSDFISVLKEEKHLSYSVKTCSYAALQEGGGEFGEGMASVISSNSSSWCLKGEGNKGPSSFLYTKASPISSGLDHSHRNLQKEASPVDIDVDSSYSTFLLGRPSADLDKKRGRSPDIADESIALAHFQRHFFP